MHGKFPQKSDKGKAIRPQPSLVASHGAWQEEEVSLASVDAWPLLRPKGLALTSPLGARTGRSRTQVSESEVATFQHGIGGKAGNEDGSDAGNLNTFGLSRPSGDNIFWIHRDTPQQCQDSDFCFLQPEDGRLTQRLTFDLRRELHSSGQSCGGCLLGARFEHVLEGSSQSSHLVVSIVEPGSQLRRTMDGNPGVCSGDTIVQVEEESGGATAIREQLGRCASLGGKFDLVVNRRPPMFEVELRCDSLSQRGLGLKLDADGCDLSRLKVKEVNDKGLVAVWNARHASHRICCGDWIMQVNGQTRSAIDMHSAILEMSEGPFLRLVIATPQHHVFQPSLHSPIRTTSADDSNLKSKRQDSVVDGFVEVLEASVPVVSAQVNTDGKGI